MYAECSILILDKLFNNSYLERHDTWCSWGLWISRAIFPKLSATRFQWALEPTSSLPLDTSDFFWRLAKNEEKDKHHFSHMQAHGMKVSTSWIKNQTSRKGPSINDVRFFGLLFDLPTYPCLILTIFLNSLRGHTQGFLTVITLQIDATIGWSNLGIILF